MSKTLGVLLVALAAALILISPAVAQGDGNLAQITYWTIDDGSTEEFEAGLKAHNEFHAAHNDPVAIQTWIVTSGPYAGQYGRGSFGHSWADFDQDPELLAADTADSANTITPHIAAANSMVWVAIPNLSNPRQSPGGIMRIIEFAIRPGHEFAFEEAVGKIHAALSKQESWPPYEWYSLVDGGYTPTWAVVLPRDTWAGFAPGDVSFTEAVSAEHGDQTIGIFQSLGEATKSQLTYTIVARPDLSYVPAATE